MAMAPLICASRGDSSFRPPPLTLRRNPVLRIESSKQRAEHDWPCPHASLFPHHALLSHVSYFMVILVSKMPHQHLLTS